VTITLMTAHPTPVYTAEHVLMGCSASLVIVLMDMRGIPVGQVGQRSPYITPGI
jgi:hypothetical protein